jgi:pentapeptide MXKDX repeat protein
MSENLRALLSISALALAVGLASPAAFAQDKMGKDGMSKDTISKDAMS